MYKKRMVTFISFLVLTTLFLQACSINMNQNQSVDQIPTEKSSAISPTESSVPVNSDKSTDSSEQNSNSSNIQSTYQHEVTLEQIKSAYKQGEILDINTYGDNYVLVKSHEIPEPGIALNPNDVYTFYNLKTGDKDILDTSPFIVELQKIESPNHILFSCNGQNIMAPFHDFPFILSFERKEENVDSESDFTVTHVPQYYSLEKSMTFGDASNAIISDINISSTSIEVKFAGSNSPYDFILADGRIPVTKVEYSPNMNSIMFQFKGSFIDKKYKDSSMVINQGNDFMDSVELKENPDNACVTINLKPSVKQYSCRITADGALEIFFADTDEVKVVTLEEIPALRVGTTVEIGWAFSYIRYDGRFYQISSDKVLQRSEVGDQISVVKRFLPSSMIVTGEKFIDKDGDSNYLPEGSLIYEFKGKAPSEMIIVDDKGVFREAILYKN